MQILGLLGMTFDVAVLFVMKFSTLFRLSLAILRLFDFGTINSFLVIWAEIECAVHVALPK